MSAAACAERGVVWEETIILLPDKVHFVFLSATIPNSTEFACWIAKLHKQPCNVVYTDYRPTPLQHYIFPAGGDGLYLVVDEKSNFREDNFQKALSVLNAADAPDLSTHASSCLFLFVSLSLYLSISLLLLLPCLIFSFPESPLARLAFGPRQQLARKTRRARARRRPRARPTSTRSCA
jgi:hypothetical protein